jgi:4-hydroxy-tetrahydrodipicolinate reductase
MPAGVADTIFLVHTVPNMTKSIKVMVYGFGYIGRMVVEALETESPFWNRKLEVVSAVDIVPESRSWATRKGIKAYDSLAAAVAKVKPDVCIHTTTSSLKIALSQIESLLVNKIPVVSSSEELFFPWVQNLKSAEHLDKVCKDNQVSIMGTGVNPGFVMDVLPAFVTQAVHTVEHISVRRLVNTATRRPPLQRKVGLGLDEPTFYATVKTGKIGHVGIKESLDFLAAYMGWTLTDKGDEVEPEIAPRAIKTKLMNVKKGMVCGLRHRAWGEIDGRRVIDLELVLSLLATKPSDRVIIKGNPTLTLNIEGGTPGEEATVSSLIRGIPIVLQAKPGLVRRLERDHFI